MNITTFLCLAAISFFVALFTYIISQKRDSKYTEVHAIPVIALAALLFTASETFEFRLTAITILIVAYVLSYLLILGIDKLWHAIFKKDRAKNTANEAGIKVKLPLGYDYTVDTTFVENLPANIAQLANVCDRIHALTSKFSSEFPNLSDDKERDIYLKTFFTGICYSLTSLFDNDTRIHVRRLTDSAYVKYVATYENGDYRRPIKPMSLDNRMILESYHRRRSLIKAYNLELHEEGNNHKWKNYLTFALPQIMHGDHPVFSIGISITRKRNEMFNFLNYCEIETVVGRYIEQIAEDDKCHVRDFVERFYFAAP